MEFMSADAFYGGIHGDLSHQVKGMPDAARDCVLYVIQLLQEAQRLFFPEHVLASLTYRTSMTHMLCLLVVLLNRLKAAII